jgi:hypothetical protein
MPQFLRRMVRASLLEAEAYEEVEADRSLTLQALGVVVLSALGLGIGNLENHGREGVLICTVHAIVLWYVWAYVTYLIGTRLLPTDETVADHGELLRTIGFSSAPGILRVFMLVPGLSGIVFFASALWMLVAMVVAVRQALDYRGTLRAIAVCAIGFPVYALGLLASVVLLGPWPM